MSEEFYQITHDRLAELTTAETQLTTLRAENGLMREALENVVHPLLYLQRKAESEGARLGGQAYQIANDLPFVQSIARNALAQVAK